MAGTAQMPEISEQNEALKRENAQLYAQIKALSQRLAQGSAGESPVGMMMRFQTQLTSPPEGNMDPAQTLLRRPLTVFLYVHAHSSRCTHTFHFSHAR